VQLPHLSQLRLHHGRLGVHREGDWQGSQPCGPLFHSSLAAHTVIKARGAWKLRIKGTKSGPLWGTEGGSRLRAFFFLNECLTADSDPVAVEGEEGIWGIWRCEGFFLEQVLCAHPFSLPFPSTHKTVGCDISLCQRLCTFLPFSLQTPPPLIWNLLLNSVMILKA
jgi:hypothetical protein